MLINSIENYILNSVKDTNIELGPDLLNNYYSIISFNEKYTFGKIFTIHVPFYGIYKNIKTTADINKITKPLKFNEFLKKLIINLKLVIDGDEYHYTKTSIPPEELKINKTINCMYTYNFADKNIFIGEKLNEVETKNKLRRHIPKLSMCGINTIIIKSKKSTEGLLELLKKTNIKTVYLKYMFKSEIVHDILINNPTINLKYDKLTMESCIFEFVKYNNFLFPKCITITSYPYNIYTEYMAMDLYGLVHLLINSDEENMFTYNDKFYKICKSDVKFYEKIISLIYYLRDSTI